MEEVALNNVQTVKRILRAPEKLVTINGYPAMCPFQPNKRCMTSCALCTEVVIDVIDDDGEVHFLRTGEWQCSLANDGNTLTIEREWIDGTYNPTEIVEDNLDYLGLNDEQDEEAEDDEEDENAPQ